MSKKRCASTRENYFQAVLFIILASLAITIYLIKQTEHHPGHLVKRIYLETHGQSEKLGNIQTTERITTVENSDLPVTFDPEILLYNRVPKTGSRTLVMIMKALSQQIGYNFSRSRPPFKSKLNQTEQQAFVGQMMNLSRPAAYERHINFVDFAKFGAPSPIYINLIRDPVERFLSFYYYHQEHRVNKRRVAPQQYKMIDDCIKHNSSICNDTAVYCRTITFFCGQHPMCSIPSEESLRRAKFNAIKYYKVVGIFEELPMSLKAFEKFLPQYFTGARGHYGANKAYFKRMFKTKHKFSPSPRTAVLLRDKLAYEYDFYNFIKTRLYDQLATKKVNGSN